MEWPIYKKDLLKIGNKKSNIGLCTLWTEKEKVLEKVSADNYLIAGQCYNSEGINLIIRHILANKQVRYLVLCGADLNETGEALLALKERGLEEGKIKGFDFEIEKEIPKEAIEKLRKEVDFVDKRGVDFKELDDFLSGLEEKKKWGEPEVFEREVPKAKEVLPSEKTGFIVRGNYVGEVWLKLLKKIIKFGHVKKSQYGDDQRELVGLMSVIQEEDPEKIKWEPYFQFTKKEYDNYLPQLMKGDLIKGVSYTYGSRLRNFKGINQIDSIVEKLKKAIYTRRAVGVVWDVEKDHDNEHGPCLDLVQALAQDKLHMTVYFRSNDMFGAWPQNVLALRKVHYEIAERVGVEMGNLVVISNSAHIYASNWKKAKGIVDEYSRDELELDPRGNIVIEVEKGKIKITHLSPQGKRLGEFYAESAKEAYKKILEKEMISKVAHGLDIGVELGKAEVALRNGLDYEQDNELELR